MHRGLEYALLSLNILSETADAQFMQHEPQELVLTMSIFPAEYINFFEH